MTFLGMPRSASSLGLALGVAVSLCGCTSSPASSTDAGGPPTGPADCNDLGTNRGDGFVLAGSDWNSRTHTYRESATVYACAPATSGGTVRFQVSGKGITVTPSQRVVANFPSGVVPFRVRVTKGASGSLVMVQKGSRVSSGGPGPTVVADADGWHFASSG